MAHFLGDDSRKAGHQPVGHFLHVLLPAIPPQVLRAAVLLEELAGVNFSIADWADLFGSGGPAWGDRLVTFGGVGFGIPIRTGKLTYSSSYKVN